MSYRTCWLGWEEGERREKKRKKRGGGRRRGGEMRGGEEGRGGRRRGGEREGRRKREGRKEWRRKRGTKLIQHPCYAPVSCIWERCTLDAGHKVTHPTTNMQNEEGYSYFCSSMEPAVTGSYGGILLATTMPSSWMPVLLALDSGLVPEKLL